MTYPSKYQLIGGLVLLLCFVFTGCSSRTSKTEAIRSNLDPRVRSMLEAGSEAFQRGNYKTALALADSVVQQEPAFADVYFLKGTIYLATRQFDEANNALQKVLALDEQFAGANQQLGDVATALGQPEAAISYYEKEATLHPDTDLFAKIGSLYAGAGEAEKAKRAYQKAIDSDSSNASAYMLFGQLWEQLGDLQQALRYSRKALAYHPDFPNYQFAVGAQLLRAGEVDEAVQYLQSAADAQPLHYPAQYNLAQALMKLNRREEAALYFTKADTARVLLDNISLIEQAAARQPGQPVHLTQLGNLYFRAGMKDRATTYFEAVLRMDPGNLDAQNGLARLALASGNTAEAIRRFKLLLFSDPKRTDAWLALGQAHAKDNNCTEARKAWQKALTLDPASAEEENHPDNMCQANQQ